MNEIFDIFMNNRTLKLVMLFICLDTLLGLLRAFKAHEFNSSAGIDGAIRKVAMLVSVALLLLADHIVQVNLLSYVPGNVTDALGIHKIGMSELFGLLYVLYESVSIMKNMVLLGLPIPEKLKSCMEVFLSGMTTELETPVAPYLNQIASYSSAITESTANEVIDYVTHKKELTLSNIQKTVSTIFEDTVVNGTITMLTGEIAGKIVPVKGKYPVKGGVTRVVLSRWMRTFTNQTFFQAIEIGALFVSKINDLRRRYEH